MISSMLWTVNIGSHRRSSMPAIVIENEEHDSQKTRVTEPPKYPLSDRSSSSATYVSVREILDDRATTAKDHQTRKSISTSSARFPEENVCETYKEELSQSSLSSSLGYHENKFYSKSSKSAYNETLKEPTLQDLNKMLKMKAEKVAGGDSLISVMEKRNDGSCMREEINDFAQKKSTSFEYASTLSKSKATERTNETQFSRIVNPKWNTVDEVYEKEKKRIDSKKSDGNLSDILRNHTFELHLQGRTRAKSTELISKSIVPRENICLIGEKTFLTEPTTKRKLFRARHNKK